MRSFVVASLATISLISRILSFKKNVPKSYLLMSTSMKHKILLFKAQIIFSTTRLCQ